MDAVWQRVGHAAGCVGVGVSRVRVAPGKLPTPPHSHGASEELYFVLSGSGLAWQDEAVHEIRARDCVIQRADEMEHTFVAGPDGLDYLVFATTFHTELGWLPRSRAIRLGWPWVEGRSDDPWDVEAEQPPLVFAHPSERPPNIVHVDAVPEEESRGERSKGLAATAGSRRTGLNWNRVEPGLAPVPPHCHSEEEELFVILEGEATLELWPSPVMESRGAKREDHPVRVGHVISRP